MQKSDHKSLVGAAVTGLRWVSFVWVAPSTSLGRTPKSAPIKVSLFLMLRIATLGSFTPHFKRRLFHVAAHKMNHLARRDSELLTNRIKSCAVLPGHLDDSVNLFG